MPTPAQLLTLVAEAPTKIRATFDVAMTVATIEGGHDTWLFTPDAVLGAEVTAVSALAQAGATQALITVHPAVTPGQGYTGKALLAESFDGGATSPDEQPFTVPAALVEDPPEPLGVLEAWTEAVGRELRILDGVPVTPLLLDLGAEDTEAYVESTDGFPDAGAFWAAGIRHTYTDRDDGALLGVAPDELRLHSIPAGSEVTLDETTIPPLLPEA